MTAFGHVRLEKCPADRDVVEQVPNLYHRAGRAAAIPHRAANATLDEQLRPKGGACLTCLATKLGNFGDCI